MNNDFVEPTEEEIKTFFRNLGILIKWRRMKKKISQEEMQDVLGLNMHNVETDESAVTDANGDYELKTGFVGQGNLESAKPTFITKTDIIDIPEGSELVQDVNLQPMP